MLYNKNTLRDYHRTRTLQETPKDKPVRWARSARRPLTEAQMAKRQQATVVWKEKENEGSVGEKEGA